MTWIADIDMSDVDLVEYAEEVNPSAVVEIERAGPNRRIGSKDAFRYRLILRSGGKGQWIESVFVPDSDIDTGRS